MTEGGWVSREPFSYAALLEHVRDTAGVISIAYRLAHREAMTTYRALGGDSAQQEWPRDEQVRVARYLMREFARAYVRHHSTLYADLYAAEPQEGEPVGEYTLGVLGVAATFHPEEAPA